MKYFTPGVNISEFQSILIRGRSVVGVAVSILAVSLLAPTVNLDLDSSSLSGVYPTTMRPCVMPFCLLGGISYLGLKNIVLVPIMLCMLCVSCPSLLASNLVHSEKNSGFLSRSRYSMFLPVYSSITAPVNSEASYAYSFICRFRFVLAIPFASLFVLTTRSGTLAVSFAMSAAIRCIPSFLLPRNCCRTRLLWCIVRCG